jgi:hypothetical protein
LPWQEAAADRLIAAMVHFLSLNLLFWTPGPSFLGAQDTILVMLRFRGAPNGHTATQMSFFVDFV